MDNYKKRRGRPPVVYGKRSKVISVVVTEDEYKLILAMAVESGIKKSQLIRTRVLGNANDIVVNARELLNRLDEIGAELGRSGKNINALVNYVNAVKQKGALAPPVAEKFMLLLANYIKIYQALEVAIRRIISAMGK